MPFPREILTAIWFAFLVLIFPGPARAQFAGSALSLDGVNGYVQVTNAVWFNGNFTIEAWVYVRNFNNFSRLLEFANGPNSGNVILALSFGTSGDPLFGAYVNNNGPNMTSSTPLPLNQWTHLAATMNGTTGIIYINGNPTATNTALSAAPGVVRTNNYIGRSNYSSDSYANAAFEEIRIWSTARTQAQIQASMNQRLAGTETDLVGYWRGNDTSGTTLRNFSASGSLYDGTLLGGASWTNFSIPVPPPYSFGVTNIVEGPASGTDTVALAVSPLNGPWTAAANMGWLHLAPDYQGGTGATNIAFSFDANAGATRNGTISVADQTLTVIQAGATYVASPTTATPLVSSGLSAPTGVALDPAGNVYIANFGDSTIKKWNPANNTVTPLVSAGLSSPYGLAVDAPGNVYIADTGDNAVKEWNVASNTLITLIPSGQIDPFAMAVDGVGNLYISDYVGNAIKKWNATDKSITTVVSSGLNGPIGVALDAAGNIYIADYHDSAIKKWTAANGSLSTLISGLPSPSGVAVDGAGNVYAADTGGGVKKWIASSNTVVAIPALGNPYGIAVDWMGNLFVANDNDGTVRELPRAFVDLTVKIVAPFGGSSSLPPVLPSAENLLPPFAPASDQSWLTLAGVTNGQVYFSFTANNTGSNRTAHVTLYDQTILVTQSNNSVVIPPILFNSTLLSNHVLRFSFSNTQSASFTVLSTTNLASPLADWTAVGAPSNVAAGLFQFTSLPLTDGWRFYRVRSP